MMMMIRLIEVIAVFWAGGSPNDTRAMSMFFSEDNREESKNYAGDMLRT